jgi:hypothetical protein
MKQIVSQQGVTRGATEAGKQAQRFEWELVQGTRVKVTLALTLMTLAVQGALRMIDCLIRTVSFRTTVCSSDLPMSVMNICMVFIDKNTHRVVCLPLAPLMSASEDSNDRHGEIGGCLAHGLGAFSRLQAERAKGFNRRYSAPKGAEGQLEHSAKGN